MEPAVSTYRVQMKVGPNTDAQEVASAVMAAMREVAEFVGQEGGIIGHVKALVDAGEHGILFVSLTETGRAPDTKGFICHAVQDAELTFYTVAYGVDQVALDRALRKAVVEQARACGLRLTTALASCDPCC
jgi:hypothetical protein